MELVELEYLNKDLPQGWQPYYIFAMVVSNQEVGKLILREGTRDERYYDGHIGYTVEPEFRGHHYAYQAVCQVLKLAPSLGFQELIITCSPENIASKKTIVKLPVQYLETVTIPKALRHNFTAEETKKEIYLIDLR